MTKKNGGSYDLDRYFSTIKGCGNSLWAKAERTTHALRKTGGLGLSRGSFSLLNVFEAVDESHWVFLFDQIVHVTTSVFHQKVLWYLAKTPSSGRNLDYFLRLRLGLVIPQNLIFVFIIFYIMKLLGEVDSLI